MSIIKLNDITKIYNEVEVLKSVNLDINEGEHIGIVGKNGSGKSTLIKIIMGLEDPDKGKVQILQKNIGYLKQATEYNASEFINIFNEKSKASEFLKLFKELKIDNSVDFSEERMKNLSGGEKTKLILSYILSQNPEILLLDEPTNHVDIESIEWLINKIKNFNGTVLAVSHDRYFLNNIVDKIIEIEDGKVTIYYGNYDEYHNQKETEKAQLMLKYENQQKQDKKIQKEIMQLKNWSEKGEKEAGRQGGSLSDAKVKGVKTNAQRKAAKAAKSAESKKNRLEQMREDYIAKPKEEKQVKFSFNGFSNGHKSLINFNEVSKNFGLKKLFENVSFSINSGEKIGLIGPNGCGKTTLINMILGKEIITSGEIWKTPSLKFAYMSQDVFDLENKKTIMELANSFDYNTKQLFLTNLVNMGFNREQFKTKINNLSLGERMRIKLAQIIVGDYNLLILDEPTNHLDLANKIELENALKRFPGSILIASHDQFLLKEVTNKILVFNNKKIIRYEGGYQEYKERENNLNNNLNQNLSISDQLRLIEEKMADPTKTENEIQELLNSYYELLDLNDKIKLKRTR